MPALTATETLSHGPIVKRQKLTVSSASAPKRGTQKPRIFAPFRTVGLVSPTDVPFTTVPLGKTTFQITTSVGRSLQTYDLKKGLHLVFLTRPQTPEIITATTAWNNRVLAAWGGKGSKSSRGIWIFQRGKKVDELELPKGTQENVKQLLVFGSWIVGCCASKIEVWKSTTLEHYTTLQGASPSVLSGGVCNMPTYLNKIFAGRKDGTVEVWNLSTGKLLYTILPETSTYGAVTALEPTPTISLLAIAYASGPVVVHDIRQDKQLLRLNTGASVKSPITSISFRSDGLGAGEDGREDGVMATASNESGDVTFWDLNKNARKMGIVRGAHNPPSLANGGIGGGISKIEFLAGQSVILTSGLDNSLKSWIFDETPFSPVPRILHSRSGHAAPISQLQFLPSDADGTDAGGKWLLSASRDRSLWGWSLRRDGQSTELSQGNIKSKAKKMGILGSGLRSLDPRTTLEDLKAPRITCLACSLNRDGGMGAVPDSSKIWDNAGKNRKGTKGPEAGNTGWESVVTGHEGDKTARTWFWGRKRAGRWAFETGDGAEVTSVAVSPCGTFALIGSAAGGIDMFNLQSGIHRQRFPARLTPIQAKRLRMEQLEAEDSLFPMESGPKKFARGQGKHTKAVTGIVVDSLNRIAISCGADGKVKFWDFKSGLLLHEIDWYPMTSIISMRYHRPSDLIALSCDDGSIRVVDIETRKLVRELWTSTTHTQVRPVDFTFSNDGRWVISASTDSIIRVWDLPTGHMIEAMKLHSPCTALAFSNTGEYLATTQEDSVGVHIWTNRTLFTHVPTRHISENEIASIDAPTASGEGGEGMLEAAVEEDETAEDGSDDESALPSIDQLSDRITTLSLVPKSRWQNLLYLDVIRARNKPKEAPKAPEKAPFFLPALNQDPHITGIDSSTAVVPASAEASRIMPAKLSRGNSSTNDFTSLLQDAATTGISTPLITHLSALSPSAADIAIRTLDATPPYTELLTFMQALTSRLRERRDYELVQAWMAVFLRLHGDTIVRDATLVAAVREWQAEAKRERERLGSLVGFAVGVVGWVRSARS
ncbi:WD repeat-containing protein 36 [Lophium mytilinum]|uniref:WD repeat-containing protein 36 n=1 Tax=Lophium mytilinum TaxID=390894 RepID=A0A6A6R9Z7_9PEZI|nr:WD repeat-containing protein 36 [Lophium mytilinum]